MSLLRRRQWHGVGWGGACAQLRPRARFVGPFVCASCLLGPWFPVCRVSLSDCAPCAALNGRICSLLARSDAVKVLPWVVEGAGGLGAGKTSGAGTRGVSLDVVIGGRTGYSDTNGGESSNN